ncbi:MAG: C-GCAxxG-C-C family protein [Oscillospiraceae bacterium]|nr:C-GCAxxG-C-C family protein [Oscillospiraceae bacterium]
MSDSEKAVLLHEQQGDNCCQAVLCAACGHCGLDEETAYRLGAFFGSGMRRGEVCGSVTGALMVLGLQYGDENNRKCQMSKEFLTAFESRFGSLLCRDLKRGEQKASCAELIAYAADYLEEHL